MARRRSQRRAGLLALLLAASGAGPAVDTAVAQGGPLVYEKQLDLRLNPTPVRGAEDQAPPPPGHDAPPSGGLVSLPALVPDVRGAARIINGEPAPAGKWRSTVNLLSVRTRADGTQSGAGCGGTLIDERWVLTAAHCVFNLDSGGVRHLRWVTAYANDVLHQKGTALRVKAVYVNSEYDAQWFVNDVALLELERAAALPRQKLTAGTGRSSFLAPGTMATVVGWGLTKPWKPGDRPGPGSPVLLEASVPIARPDVCDALRRSVPWSKPGRPMGDAELCAGYGKDESKPRTCNGDSGGPIFVAGAHGEAIQAGITSWGLVGCPGLYSVYASVGYFEPWIRKRVPNAVFAMPRPGASSGPLDEIAGAEPGGPPAPHGQCAVDIKADGAAVNRVRVGSHLTVRVTSGVTGQLAVFSRTAGGKMVQLFPNRFRGSAPAGLKPTAVRAGDVVAIPEPADGFSVEVSPPLGRYEIIAMVVPDGVNLADIARPFESMAPIDDFDAVLAGIGERTRRQAETAPGAPRAVCTRQFDVVAQ